MKKVAAITLAVSMLVGTTGCVKKILSGFLHRASDTGKSADDGEGVKRDEGTNPAEALKQFAEQMQKSAESAGEVEAADADLLASGLPDVEGYVRSDPDFEKNAVMKMVSSQIEAEYSSGDKSVTVKIVDTGSMATIIQGLKMFISTGMEHEDSSGYQKVFSRGGVKGMEEWNKDSGSGHLSLLVNERTMVEIQGSSGVSMDTLHSFIQPDRYADLP